MIPTILILDGVGTDWGPGALPDTRLHDCLLRDTIELAAHLPNVHSHVIRADTAYSVADAALAIGPVVVITADVPHLPVWRLRDAFTHLQAGADAVIGPAECGGWYLLGLAAGRQHLLPQLPLVTPGSADDLAAVRGQTGTLVTLSAWYRLTTAADLSRVAADLGPMPPTVAACTRALLGADGLYAREVGG